MLKHLSYGNVVATLCLFVVLGGVSYAATELGNDTVKSRHIVNGEVKSADLADDKVKGKDVSESSLGTVPDADQLDGQDSSDFLGANAKAADADTLDGLDSSELAPRSVLSGRITGVLAENLSYGAPVGISNAIDTVGPVETLSPPYATVATEFNVKTSGNVGDDGFNVYLFVNGTPGPTGCHASTSAGCTAGADTPIPAGSRLAVAVANTADPSPGDLLFSITLASN